MSSEETVYKLLSLNWIVDCGKHPVFLTSSILSYNSLQSSTGEDVYSHIYIDHFPTTRLLKSDFTSGTAEKREKQRIAAKEQQFSYRNLATSTHLFLHELLHYIPIRQIVLEEHLAVDDVACRPYIGLLWEQSLRDICSSIHDKPLILEVAHMEEEQCIVLCCAVASTASTACGICPCYARSITAAHFLL